jgi:hypothetical protein
MYISFLAPWDRDNARRPASRWTRGDEIAAWTVPSATLALFV